MKYGIQQNVGDTVGIGGVLRTMRTAPEMLAIGRDMLRRCPGAVLINYVNPMSMLTRIMNLTSDAVLEKDLRKAYQGRLLDPLTAACAAPADICKCFNELLAAEAELLEPYWGKDLKV